VNIPAIVVWDPAHVLPDVLAVSALHEYAGLHHHGHVGKHIWMLTVVIVAIIGGLGVWYYRRRQNGSAAAAKLQT